MLLLSCLIQAKEINSMDNFVGELPQQFFSRFSDGQCLEDEFEWRWNTEYICCRKDDVYGGYQVINDRQHITLERFSEESHAKTQWRRLEKILKEKNKK